MSTLLQDLRYAFRNLLKSRGFAAVAAAALALGIGANTAIFSIVDTVLLRPLPYRHPEQLLRLYETERAPGRYPFAGMDFLDWKTQNKSFQDMTLFGWRHDLNLSDNGRPDHVTGVPTEANFFSLLGVAPILGRTWAADEDQPGKNQVVILSYGLWRSRFGGDPGVIGRTLELDSKKHTIIGVMPASFRFPNAQVWTPLEMTAKGVGERGSHWASAIGRLKPGVTVKAAQAELTLIASRIEKLYPESNDKVGAAVVPLHDDLVGNSGDSLVTMLAAVGLVLLIACANVANLLLSRAVARQKEMAVRSALGAPRGRLVRQLLTESWLLSLAGGAAGLFLGWGIVSLFAGAKSFAVPQFNVIQLNATVLGFTFAVAVVTGALFGIFPAFQTARADLHDELKGGAGSSVSPGRRRRFASNALVAGEIALSMILLSSAGLLLKDFARLRSLDIGVRSEGVWTAAVQLTEANYKTGRRKFDFAESLLEKARRIPGVTSAALSDRMPLEGGGNYYIKLRGQEGPENGQLVERHSVSPEYFHTLGVRLLEGRVFTPAEVQATLALDELWTRSDESGAHLSPEQTNAMITPTVINASMARHFWPGRSPVGQMFGQGEHGPWKQVIGVVSDVRDVGLTNRPAPEAHDPFDGGSRLFLILHTSIEPAGVTAPVRRELARLDASLPLFSVRTMDDVVADSAQDQRFTSLLVGSFAALAALLAAVGIYGVLSYAVTQRTREIGIRMSLGASRRQVLGEVLGQGARLALVGLAIGVAGALAAGRVVASLLHEVKPGDLPVLLLTAGLLLAVALAASWLPARRAAKLDPMTALRHE